MMKTRFGLLLVPALLIGLWPASVEGQRQVEFEFTPLVGGTFFLANPPAEFMIRRGDRIPVRIEDGEFKDQLTLGIDAGVRINEHYAVEAFFSWLPTELSATRGVSGAVDVTGYMYGLSFLYHFDPAVRFKPFLGVGLGAERFDYQVEDWETDTEFMGNVVVGANVPLTDMLAVKVVARDCIAWFDSRIAGIDRKAQNDLMLMTGLNFRIW